jgi:hypothetical protein
MHDPEHAKRTLGHVSIAPPDPSWPEITAFSIALFARRRSRLPMLVESARLLWLIRDGFDDLLDRSRNKLRVYFSR